MQTDFEKLVSGNGNEGSGSGEKRPLFFSKLHSIPKQVSDSSQAIGVNERTLKNGLMSGVILPSQISHDRWLSIVDGAMDAFILFIVIHFISLSSIGFTQILIILVSIVYMYFHILWWEYAIQWLFIETIKEYVSKTRTYYYFSLIAVFITLSSIGNFYISQIDGIEKINKIFVSVENSFKNIFPRDIYLEKKEILPVDKKNKFSNDETYNNTEDVKKESKKEIEDIVIEKRNTSNLLFFYLNSIIASVLLYFFFKYSFTHYDKKRVKNLEDVDVELKTELEQRMALLKEQV